MYFLRIEIFKLSVFITLLGTLTSLRLVRTAPSRNHHLNPNHNVYPNISQSPQTQQPQQCPPSPIPPSPPHHHSPTSSPSCSYPSAGPSTHPEPHQSTKLTPPRGLTSPFLRLAALNAPPTPIYPTHLTPFQLHVKKLKFSIWSLITRPSYLIPLVINLTGSVWFFILIGGAELSLTVPIVNSMALGFTAAGDWMIAKWRGEEKRVTLKGVVGGALVVGGVWVCFLSKM